MLFFFLFVFHYSLDNFSPSLVRFLSCSTLTFDSSFKQTNGRVWEWEWCECKWRRCVFGISLCKTATTKKEQQHLKKPKKTKVEFHKKRAEREREQKRVCQSAKKEAEKRKVICLTSLHNFSVLLSQSMGECECVYVWASHTRTCRTIFAEKR